MSNDNGFQMSENAQLAISIIGAMLMGMMVFGTFLGCLHLNDIRKASAWEHQYRMEERASQEALYHHRVTMDRVKLVQKQAHKACVDEFVRRPGWKPWMYADHCK